MPISFAGANAPARSMREVDWFAKELRRTGYSAAQVTMVVDYHREHGHRLSLSQVLIELGLVGPVEVAKLVATYWGVRFVTGRELIVEGDAHKLIPAGMARSRCALPLARINGTGVRLAVADPGIANFSQVSHALRERGLRGEIVIAPQADITAKLDEIHTSRVTVNDEASVNRFVEAVIREAYEARSSDIYFTPLATSLSIGFKIDGKVMPRHAVTGDRKSAVLNAVKIAANQGKNTAAASSMLDVGDRLRPQDASATRQFGSARVNLRFSSMPVLHGESIVVRLLDQAHGPLSLENLGFSSQMTAYLLPMLLSKDGVIFNCGPTGSGKTTTLYSMVGATNWASRGLAVSTLEDPIEYEISGPIRQSEITERMGWATGLRAILRQAPDIILVGECRDREVAAIAIEASLTGHKLFSTLHTKGGLQGFARLLELGVEPGAICAAVTLFIAQRLAKRVCPNCRKPHPRASWLADQNAALLAESGITTPTFFEGGAGCPQCNGNGFKGRVGMYELVPVWPFQQLVLSKGTNASPAEYAEVVRSYNESVRSAVAERAKNPTASIDDRFANAVPIRPMRDDGIIKAALGITTPEEVWAQS